MIKFVCDRCGKDITGTHPGYIAINYRNTDTGELTIDNPLENCHYCSSCMEQIKVFVAKKPETAIETIERIVKAEGIVLKQEETVTKPEEAVPDEGKPKKRIDVGKVMALKNAGWKNKAIAEEMNLEPQTVANIVYQQKKKIEEASTVKMQRLGEMSGERPRL